MSRVTTLSVRVHLTRNSRWEGSLCVKIQQGRTQGDMQDRKSKEPSINVLTNRVSADEEEQQKMHYTVKPV